MKTTNNLYHKIYEWENLVLAFKKARKGKTKKIYVLEFQENAIKNLEQLQFELMSQTYKPKPLETFILRDPKTRKISKSDFRDRIIHHALCNIIEPILQKIFIYDSCANQKRKGSLFAIKRFDLFKRKATNNLKSEAFCFKADIKHYFEEVNHETLIQTIKRKIKDEKIIWLIKNILERETTRSITKGMPLGNLTSQFFANIYLNELDHFVKHNLKVKYYLRYVDDFIILHKSKKQLKKLMKEVDKFLKTKLKLELHPQKSKITLLSKGIDFVGFRNFYHHRLLRKRNVRGMKGKIELFKEGKIFLEKFSEICQGWEAYAKWADAYKLRKDLL